MKTAALFTMGSEPPIAHAAPMQSMVEAVKNLIDNAMIHGGENLSQIHVTLKADAETAF
ncbi:MAG: hypothetical protein VX444_06085 [Pseudomonadota bacterium]|nr:hypothetical protein [Pseudomonadota bacterium]